MLNWMPRRMRVVPRRPPRAVWWGCTLASLAVGLHLPAAQAQPADELMEVYWQFRHAGVVNTIVGARYDGERFYLSLGDLFNALQLDLTQDLDARTAAGFYLRTDRPYVLDFGTLRAEVAGRTVPLDPADVRVGRLGYYVHPDLLQAVFGLQVVLQERHLALLLMTDETMPVVAAYERRATRRVRGQLAYLEPPAPLLFDRQRALLNGGVMGYRLSAGMQGTMPRVHAALRGGGEVLGGDLEAGLTGRYAPTPFGPAPLQFDVETWRWRYVWHDGALLTQATAGALVSSGLRHFSYRGVALSNEPVQVERFYGTFPFRVESRPGWEIELYLNNQLIDVHTADATGVHTFAVPITYGSTSITVREYGPNGEFEESARRLQVPFTFIRRGQVRYTLHAGHAPYEERNLLQGRLSAGLTHWLTAQFGFDYVAAGRHRPGTAATRQPYGTLSARLGAPYIFTAEVAPGARYRASLDAYYPSLLTFGLDFTRYGHAALYSTTPNRHQASARLSLPFRIGRLPVSLRTSLVERQIRTRQYTYTFSQDVALQPRGFQVGLGLRGTGVVLDGLHRTTSLQVDGRFGMALPRREGVPRLLQGILATFQGAYDLHHRRAQRFSLGLSRSLSRHLRLQVDATHYAQSRATSLGVRLAFNVSTVRTTTHASFRTGGEPTFSQDVSGALSYDAGARSVELADQNWVGRAAATMRLFVDEDSDGRWDAEEPYIEHGGVNFRQAVSTQQGSDGFIVAYNLLAYEQYSVEVDQSRVRNPLWVPRFETFSFITDPNSHKVIDIPFYVSGMVTGSVLREREGGATEAVPGMKLHIRQVGGEKRWTEPVFSDGSFYKVGLPPGDYEAYVDAAQLDVLKATAYPAVQRFTVEMTAEGDMVEDVHFRLRPREE